LKIRVLSHSQDLPKTGKNTRETTTFYHQDLPPGRFCIFKPMGAIHEDGTLQAYLEINFYLETNPFVPFFG